MRLRVTVAILSALLLLVLCVPFMLLHQSNPIVYSNSPAQVIKPSMLWVPEEAPSNNLHAHIQYFKDGNKQAAW